VGIHLQRRSTGAVLGPLLFNIFINVIFYLMEKSSLYNYADDNTLSCIHTDPDYAVDVLQRESEVLVDWFADNGMKANPDKFQAICIGKKMHDHCSSISIGGIQIPYKDTFKLLGVDIDFLLSFNNHISEMCRKTSGQLNVLKRIGRHLTLNGK
jgi:hypothetical protein